MQPIRERPRRAIEQTVFSFPVRVAPEVHHWHVHRDVELVVITDGSGLRYVGDSIEEFEAAEVVLVGSNLPHAWCAAAGSGGCVAEVMHIDPARLDGIPELDDVLALASSASRGLRFPAADPGQMAAWLQAARSDAGPSRLLAAMHALDELSQLSGSAVPLASAAYDDRVVSQEGPRAELRNNRTNAVISLIARRFDEPLVQADVAAEVGLSPASFSRFFRRETGRTFTSYLQEVRISEACRLLGETDKGVTAIANEVGFGNIAHFNRTFRSLKGTTPTGWRRVVRQRRRPSFHRLPERLIP